MTNLLRSLFLLTVGLWLGATLFLHIATSQLARTEQDSFLSVAQSLQNSYLDLFLITVPISIGILILFTYSGASETQRRTVPSILMLVVAFFVTLYWHQALRPPSLELQARQNRSEDSKEERKIRRMDAATSGFAFLLGVASLTLIVRRVESR
ncbi:MAG: hypothetical protein QF752_16540 [Planctomycetota bacterium]|jgi:hypothetical protein|nr:hypothetical protein [Planctomycetota bacterium]